MFGWNWFELLLARRFTSLAPTSSVIRTAIRGLRLARGHRSIALGAWSPRAPSPRARTAALNHLLQRPDNITDAAL